jgi:RNA polymerase-binding transcription factor DksA
MDDAEASMNTQQISAQRPLRGTPNSVARERLLAEKGDLWRQLQASSGNVTGLDKIADEDQARVLHDQFVLLSVGHLAYRRLKRIDAALARLADGSYGICEDCGGPISPKRLAAIPSAERCIACEERVTNNDDGPAPRFRSAA